MFDNGADDVGDDVVGDDVGIVDSASGGAEAVAAAAAASGVAVGETFEALKSDLLALCVDEGDTLFGSLFDESA